MRREAAIPSSRPNCPQWARFSHSWHRRAQLGIVDVSPIFRSDVMSVAFRRESDDEHKEPRFERPIPSGPNYVTPRGLKLIVDKIAELEAILAVGRRAAFRTSNKFHFREIERGRSPI